MNAELIESSLRSSPHYEIPADSRLDIEEREDGAFRVTEVRPDLSVGKRFTGFIHQVIGNPGASALSHSQDPDLSLAQLAVYEPVLRDFQSALLQARQGNRSEFLLVKDGQYPNLFMPPSTADASIHGTTRHEMLPVLHALEDWLRLEGYKIVKRRSNAEPWEIWATVYTPMHF